MFTFGKTRYINGTLDHAVANVNGYYLTRDEALKYARLRAKDWYFQYTFTPDVAHASYMETPQGATILVELKDGRNILTYFEVASE